MIVWPFAALILAIFVIRIMRGFRRAGELLDKRVPLSVPSEHRRPTDDFHDKTWLPLCERVASIACVRTHRPLTQKERRIIWRARAPVVLEAALQEMEEANGSEAVGALLARLPSGLDRPDPTRWCEKDAV